MTKHLLHPLMLVAIEQLKPRLHRLTFTAEVFADYPLSGPDEYFGLLMPRPGQHFRPFGLNSTNIRAAVATIPQETRPDLRWYTIRSLDRERKLMDVDVVTHGDTGPGSRWIRQARPGDTAGMFTGPPCGPRREPRSYSSPMLPHYRPCATSSTTSKRTPPQR